MARAETGELVLAIGQQLPVNIGSETNYLYCYDQTGLVEVDLYRESKLVETHVVERLLNLPGKNFDAILIRNKHTAENTVRFFFGRGDYVPNADRSVVVIDDAIPPEVSLTPGSTIELTGSTINVTSDVAAVFVSVPDVSVTGSATLIAAANTDRLELIISVKETAANGIRLGDNGVTATRGVYIAPGQSFTVANRGALYGIRDGASSVDVTILESEKTP